jgi:hypothetical protein
MTARLILQIDMRNMMGLKSGVEKFGVVIVHHRIVLAVHKEHRWTVLWHVLFQ